MTAAIRTALERDLRARSESEEDRYAQITAILAGFHRPAEWKDKTSKQVMDAMSDEQGLPI